jgi:transcriptional antiterminator NusG
MAKKKTTQSVTDMVEASAEPAVVPASEPVDTGDDNANNDLMKWYIVNTYSGHENKVAQQIEQRVKANGLDEEVAEVLVPIQEKIVAKEGKKKTIEEKIFPGYVLIKMIMNDQTWHIIRNTEGVTGFVGPSKKPTPLNEDEVKAILAFTSVQQTAYQASFRVGEAVRVTDGPFKDFVGRIEEINESKGQLTVLLSIFGRETPVQLDFLQVTNL